MNVRRPIHGLLVIFLTAAVLGSPLRAQDQGAAVPDTVFEIVQVAIDDLMTAKAMIYRERNRSILSGKAVTDEELIRKLTALRADELFSEIPLTRADAEQVIGMQSLRLTDVDLRAWLTARHGFRDDEAAQEAIDAYHAGLSATNEARVSQAIEKLNSITGVEPIASELAVETGVNEKRVAEIMLNRKEQEKEEKKKADASSFKRWGDSGFSLQRALTGPDEGEPAALSLLRTAGADTVYSASFALIWEDPAGGSEATRFGWSIEGSVTSDESKSENALRARASVSSFIDGIADNLFTTISLKYETDQDFNTQKVSAELVLTPNWAHGFIGKASGDYDDPWQFRWRPFGGIDAGHTFDDGDSMETDDTVLRLVGRVRAEIYLNFLRDPLRVQDAVLFVDNTYRFLPLEDGDDSFNYFVAGLSFRFNEYVGLEITYKNGEDAPLFDDIETFGVSIGVRF